jgi:hypothetical protein
VQVEARLAPVLAENVPATQAVQVAMLGIARPVE